MTLAFLGEYHEVSDELFRIEQERAQSLALKARAEFDRFVDMPSSVFTNLIKQRAKVNKIVLSNVSSLVYDRDNVAVILCQHWADIHRRTEIEFNQVFTSFIPKSPHTLDGPISGNKSMTYFKSLFLGNQQSSYTFPNPSA